MNSAIEHTYRYAFASALQQSKSGMDVRLATSGGVAESPYFFQGQLRQPRITAQLLRTLAKVVGARFFTPPAMLNRILRTKDPVVTSGGGLLRFEGFSACCSAYARVDLSPDAYEGVVAGQGTTNVDFNSEMRAALAQVRDGERVSLAVGTDEVALLRGSDQVVERKVDLPLRWIRGLVEVQAYQARMEKRAEIGRVETLRFLRSLPKTTTNRSTFWLSPGATGLRFSLRESPDGIKVTGLDRLRLLEDLALFAQSLHIYADARGEASEWVLNFGPVNFHLTVSAEVWRGFSGEGQALSELAGGERERILSQVRGMLKWQAELRLEEFAANWDVPPKAIREALAALGSRGLVGFDVTRGAYFHRELPFDLNLIEEMHPRLKGARKLVDERGVKILSRKDDLVEADVAGTGVTHRVRVSEARFSCTCPWHAKHQGNRGPCKHVLAVQILTENDESSGT